MQLNGYREKWRQCLANRAINIGAYAIKRWSIRKINSTSRRNELIKLWWMTTCYKLIREVRKLTIIRSVNNIQIKWSKRIR